MNEPETEGASLSTDENNVTLRLSNDSFATLVNKHGALKPGDVIADKFKVVSLIGHGGMGSVYHVEQIFLKKPYALKILTTAQLPDMAIRRFQKEAQAASKLDHPNLVKAHEFGLIEGQLPYFVMDLVEGKTLAKHLKQVGTISVNEALRLFVPVCFGLAYAHQQGVIHRDLKPSNLILSHSSQNTTSQHVAKVVDFGIAKMIEGDGTDQLTRTGEVFGTPLYMSPEQCAGGKVDHRSDIYALCCVVFEAITGAPPFSGDTALATMMRHQSERPSTLKEASLGGDFPEMLEKIIARGLEKDPDLRYQSMLDLANDLMVIQEGSSERTLVSSGPHVIEKKEKRRAGRFSLILSSCVCLLLGGVSGFLIGRSSTPPSQEKLEDIFNPSAGDRHYYFSKIEGNGPQAVRYFSIPPGVTIGTLSYTSPKQKNRIKVPVRDRFTVPAGAVLELEIDRFFLGMNMPLLNFFRSDEIRHVVIPRSHDVPLEEYDPLIDQCMAVLRRFDAMDTVLLDRTGLSDIGLEYLSNCKALCNLSINKTDVTGQALARMTKLNRLISIYAGSISEAPAMLPALNSSALTQLAINDDSITDEDLKYVARNLNLNFLVLSDNSEITSRGIAQLGSLTKLTYLTLNGTDVGPESIADLAAHKKLTYLAVPQGKWRQSDVDDLKKLLPACRIELKAPDMTGE